MNIGSTLGTAILRGIYMAVGAGLGAALPVYAVVDTPPWKPIIVAGVGAALVALGFRGGVEGLYDADRQRNDDVKASDVKVG
jgi:hypothetical protein